VSTSAASSTSAGATSLRSGSGWAGRTTTPTRPRPVTAAFAGAPGLGFTVLGAAPQRDSRRPGSCPPTRPSARRPRSSSLRRTSSAGAATTTSSARDLRMTW
jgi:hypothetical protein